MKTAIPDSVRKATTRCPHDFGCLETGRCGERDLCAVKYEYGGNRLRLAADAAFFCPYHLALGCGQLCTCPVREYLHKQATKG